ncbi:MAG: cytochrome c oxidase subunit II [Polyangiales bacterium]
MGDKDGTIQLPAQGSTFAAEIDWLYYFIYWASVIAFVAIMGAMLYFMWRYRRRPGVAAKPPAHAVKLELFWTFSPLIFLFLLFHWGFQTYVATAIAPDDARVIRVTGKQWNWSFVHENGMAEAGELTVPQHTPVKLVMSSADVLHSFFVPEFRVKKDVVPGIYSTLWFRATKKGKAQVYCTEYCGAPPGKEGNAGHSAMLATIKVVGKRDYERYLLEGPQNPYETPERWGEDLYAKQGCNACHNVDGVTKMPAPNFKGLWGKQEKLADGSTVTVDESYLYESIRQPGAKIVAGYTNVQMPPYPPQALPDKQVDAIIAYIKSLK